MFATNTKFLVVDDFSTFTKMVLQSLKDLGYQNTSKAQDGSAALKLLKEAVAGGKPFDVVLSDWNMPVLNGLELLQACRKEESLKNVGFLMITSEGDQENVIAAVKAGVNDYIVKPFSKQLLSEKLAAVYKRMNK